MIADSASGVSKHRSAPNVSASPSVTRNTPPSTATSSPNTNTRSSAAIASYRARLIAWTMVNDCVMSLTATASVSSGLAGRSAI
ncbi:Uncharacterised protein [Mycobacterium tuberculosis]|uniref:Uncharacterized protein n=1 Tax=Mycobacterium tuberculosis TaxID=1773 RepID=A0A655EW35_MYCTX|nr:Uncharacterised protein [Mycobacterium tuberculosis]CKT41985.1 Uncharacterised protein [Mycobacterium tuberculosis]CNU22349.1 Uncharacterised protein [Mycobacterium tuberculosis]CNV37602.1 Uncharacterised protein [Mycobacterium tuberculosis]CNW97850.1 Uncharacterised protein [Mycobacterium tuberculosis]